MSKDEKDTTAAEAPAKSKKMLMIVIALAVVLLGGGGAGAFVMLNSDKAAAAEEEPVKGTVLPVESALTINLADGHYLKMSFALQLTEAAADAHTEPDVSEALNLALETYTGRNIAELSTQKGRDAIKAELLEKIEKAYVEEDTKLVMDIYFTSFVTQ